LSRNAWAGFDRLAFHQLYIDRQAQLGGKPVRDGSQPLVLFAKLVKGA